MDENKEDFKPIYKTEQLSTIHGVLRKDNNPSKSLVSKNDYDQNMWSQADLKKMVGYYGFFNLETEKYYIERIQN